MPNDKLRLVLGLYNLLCELPPNGVDLVLLWLLHRSRKPRRESEESRVSILSVVPRSARDPNMTLRYRPGKASKSSKGFYPKNTVL